MSVISQFHFHSKNRPTTTRHQAATYLQNIFIVPNTCGKGSFPVSIVVAKALEPADAAKHAPRSIKLTASTASFTNQSDRIKTLHGV